MQGDFSRWTFDPRRDYRSVLLQQGRALLDADWNEQSELTRYHDEIRARDVIGRAGGPADSVGFAIRDVAGGVPADTAWADLQIMPGRYYVEGILAEARTPEAATTPGIALTDQPYLSAVGGSPGLNEPPDDGRYALYLDVWTHHVTADEDPSLRESALGGPDTSTRARGVWQVRAVKIDDAQECSDLHSPDWLATTPGTMTPSLVESPPDPDPCHISEAGGYTRLENQLYRVQIHEGGTGTASYLWSRENGSVVAGLAAISPTTTPGMSAELTLDRVGRDEELSIREGDTVEVTSTDVQLRGAPGFLATAGPPNALVLPVNWTSAAPASLASFGRAPIVRRWESPPRQTSTTPTELEGGIQVAFDGGSFRTGDYWLLPARTVRLAYGIDSLAGTIDWPTDATGATLPAAPVGSLHHVSPLAIFNRSASGWTQLSDCRRIVPSLGQLVAIDLIGGDGQETDSGGTVLSEPVRVAVRTGSLPVTGAPVRFAVAVGSISDGVTTGPQLVVATGADGVASVRWTLDPAGTPTQTLTAQRLNDRDLPVDVAVIATGRLSRGGGRTPGLHVVKATLNAGRAFENDSDLKVEELAEGITVVLDGSVNSATVDDLRRPIRVVLELPWPLPQEVAPVWTDVGIGYRKIELDAVVSAVDEQLTWNPTGDARDWLLNRLRAGLNMAHWGRPILGRFEIDGWAVVGKDAKLHLNGHANTVVDDSGRTRVVLPTDDEVTGGQFVQWFHLMTV
ncbi:DUF6519 domain-containing protein [Mycolicibacterium celeriflavum]|uniref:DUF6519 domain-containing protein n=1 Tax=Mycolicibacterium celeriflavum TaxID=1249101 RepID=UPI003CF61F9F